MIHARRPIWFDIDGTLLHTGEGVRAFGKALREVYGWTEGLKDISFAGNTDLQVLRDLAARNGWTEEAVRERRDEFFHHLGLGLDEALRVRGPTPVPGARELLEALATHAPVRLGLITGNARHCAFVKLRHAGLDHYFRDGGFGDQHHDRNELARLALTCAEEELRPGERLATSLIIGDTVRDVRAAKAIGARCLAVATGACSPKVLREAGADRVERELWPGEDLLAWILGD